MQHLPKLVNVCRLAPGSLQLQVARAYAGGYWTNDWKPGRYPTTEPERRAAAKKYGLIPEDYEPYADDGFGYGDYPKLPIVSAESRDPFGVYDFDELKRNYGEPLHIDCDMYGEDRLNYNKRYIIPVWAMYAISLGVVAVVFLLAWIGNHVRVIPVPMMPKHLHEPGKTHYSFDLKGEEHSC